LSQRLLLDPQVLTPEHIRLLREFRTTKSQVEFLLEHYPKCRCNDFYLVWMWLRRFAGVKLPYLSNEVLGELAGKCETVRRARQKIQNNEGRFLADVDTRKNRVRKMEITKEIIFGV